jgi:hypothetical protein
MPHDIQQVELFALVGKQLRDLSVILLHYVLVEFCAESLVSQVSIHVDEIPMLVDSSAQFVIQEALLVLLESL